MKKVIILLLLLLLLLQVSSDFNFKDHAFKPITALQCNYGSPEIFSNKKNMCKKVKYENKLEPENVVILQKVHHIQTEGYLCQKFESTIQELCGLWSYSKIVDLKIDSPVNISVQDCEMIRDQGFFVAPNGQKHALGQNSEVHYSYIKDGNVIYTSDNIRCHSNNAVLVGNIAMNGVVSLVSARIKFLKIPILQSPYERLDQQHGTILPKDCLHTQGCQTDFGTYLFENSRSFNGYCIYQKIRELVMQPIIKDSTLFLISEKYHIILENRSQIKYPPLFKQSERYQQRNVHCLDLEDLISTQFSNVFLVSNGTNPNVDLQYAANLDEVDSTNFSPELQNQISKQFLQYFLTEELETSLANHQEKICEAMLGNGDIFRSPYHRESLIKIDGDLVTELKCKEVGVSLRIGQPSTTEKCYSQFFLARTYDSRQGESKRVWIHLKTGLLFEKEPDFINEISCNTSEQKYVINKNSEIIALYPYPQLVENITLDHEKISIFDTDLHFHIKLENSDNLYTNSEQTEYHRAINNRATDASVHEVISDNFCDGNYCGSLEDRPSHPEIQSWSQILYSPLVGTAHQILNGFRIYGEISATLIGIYMFCKLIFVFGKKVNNRYLKVPSEEATYLENIRKELQIKNQPSESL